MADQDTQSDDGGDGEYITRREAEALIDKKIGELERELSRRTRGQ